MSFMLINTSGIAIRINVSDISITGRSTMGVRLMRTSEEEKIVAIAKISASEEDEEINRCRRDRRSRKSR